MMIEVALTRILCGTPPLIRSFQIYNFGGGCVRAQTSQALSVQTQSVQLVYMAVSRTASYKVHFHQIWLH